MYFYCALYELFIFVFHEKSYLNVADILGLLQAISFSYSCGATLPYSISFEEYKLKRTQWMKEYVAWSCNLDKKFAEKVYFWSYRFLLDYRVKSKFLGKQ